MSGRDQDQVRRLNADPALRREFEKIMLAMTKRLSGAERTALTEENFAKLGSSLGITPEQAASLKRVQDRAGVLQGQSLRQTRQVVNTHQLGIKR